MSSSSLMSQPSEMLTILPTFILHFVLCPSSPPSHSCLGHIISLLDFRTLFSSQIPEGCGFRSSSTSRPRPGPSCRPGASSLLITLTPSVPSLPNRPHLHRYYPQATIHPPPLLDHCHSLPSGLPFALSLQTVIYLAPKALIKNLPDQVTPV